MAFMSSDRKATLAPAIKAVLKKYRMRGTIAVRNHSTLVLNIKSGALNMIDNFNEVATKRYTSYGEPVKQAEKYLDINPYWYQEHFSGKCLNFLKELFAAANNGNHDRSDMMTDYFDVGWYVDVNIGNWNKPYTVE